MKKNWVLSQESFDALLDWLDPDREVAGQKYEDIRQRLIRIFASRGCAAAEDLSDETINRVANKVREVRPTYVGNPALYFYAVGNKVHREYLRRKPQPVPPPPPTDGATFDEDEAEDAEGAETPEPGGTFTDDAIRG